MASASQTPTGTPHPARAMRLAASFTGGGFFAPGCVGALDPYRDPLDRRGAILGQPGARGGDPTCQAHNQRLTAPAAERRQGPSAWVKGAPAAGRQGGGHHPALCFGRGGRGGGGGACSLYVAFSCTQSRRTEAKRRAAPIRHRTDERPSFLRKTDIFGGFSLVAKPGFEPGLTDPESAFNASFTAFFQPCIFFVAFHCIHVYLFDHESEGNRKQG